MLRFINIKLEADSESDVDRWDNLFFIFFHEDINTCK